MSELELNELINKIKQRRQELELSYQDLSLLTGISKSTLQRYETGFIKKVPISQIEIIAKALRVEPSYLMGWNKGKSAAVPVASCEKSPLTPAEESHIKKYRRLDTDGKERIDRQIDFELYEIERNAEKEEEHLA